jgi:hypothetical protein
LFRTLFPQLAKASKRKEGLGYSEDLRKGRGVGVKKDDSKKACASSNFFPL